MMSGFQIVRWSFYTMVEAEENGLTSANVDEKRKTSKVPQVMRLTGTGLQGRKALRRRQRHGLYFGSIPQNRSRHRTARIDIKTAPVAAAVHTGKTGSSGVDTANHLASGADRVQNGASLH